MLCSKTKPNQTHLPSPNSGSTHGTSPCYPILPLSIQIWGWPIVSSHSFPSELLHVSFTSAEYQNLETIPCSGYMPGLRSSLVRLFFVVPQSQPRELLRPTISRASTLRLASRPTPALLSACDHTAPVRLTPTCLTGLPAAASTWQVFPAHHSKVQ